jgi:threonine dehydrogenase-like Zn-dependent dehydrogenase
MLEKRDKPFPELITHVYPFDETQQAFEKWKSDPGSISKILIDINS